MKKVYISSYVENEKSFLKSYKYSKIYEQKHTKVHYIIQSCSISD